MKDFEEIRKYLENKGFISVSMEGAIKQIYLNKDRTIQITMEIDKSRMTREDEEKVKQRLRELGYL